MTKRKGRNWKYFVKTHFYQSITSLEKGEPPGGGGRRMILQPATPKSEEDPGGAPGALPPKIG
jgi:hypothetical protein